MMKKFALAVALAFASMAVPAVAQAPAAAAHAEAGLSVDSTMPQLLANPEAKAILEQELGAELVNNPRLSSAPMSLRALASYIPGLTEAHHDQHAIDGAAALTPRSQD
jgi:hypothetical protein